MNKHVVYRDVPVLVDIDPRLEEAIEDVIDSGYVLEAVSKAGMACTHVGYKYLVAVVEILLTEENPGDHIVLLKNVAELFGGKPNVIKRAMSVCCASCRYDTFRKYIFDAEDRLRISEKTFAKYNLVSVLGMLVAHCVDEAERRLAKKIKSGPTKSTTIKRVFY